MAQVPRTVPEHPEFDHRYERYGGGGGGIRTRVPKYQIKSLYMFSLLFNLPAGTSADGISCGQPFEASSDTLKANQDQTILLATSLRNRRLFPQDGLLYLESSACQWSKPFNHLHGCKELIH
jgi:hypothetical protein